MTEDLVYQTEARHHFDAGRFDDAMEWCQEGLRSQPNDGRLWQTYGAACWELGLVDDAREALETASCLGPLGPHAQCSLAEIYAEGEHVEAARVICTHLAERSDCPVSLLPRVARGLGRLGEHRLALTVCERLTMQSPGNHSAYFGMAFYRSLLGCGASDILLPLMQAHQLAPERISYRVSLASVLLALGAGTGAWDLIARVPPEAVHCPCCVERMLEVASRSGDEALCARWRAQLASLK